jgi:hypothetical protein
MNVKSLFAAVVACGVITAGAAQAQAITFDTFSPQYLNGSTTLTEGGYNLAYTAGSGGFAYIGRSNCSPACSDDGTNAFYSFNTGVLTVSATNNAPIAITTLDAAQTFTTVDRVLDFTVTGAYVGGGSITQEFVTAPGGADSFQTFTLVSGFTDLSSVTISGTGDYPTTEFAVDNLVVSGGGVPEPTTWALMLTGLLGLGLALRARRTAVAA